jgi:hypothetical protein
MSAGYPNWRAAIATARRSSVPELRTAVLAGTELHGGDRPGEGKLPYGDVPYADPGYQADKKNRYPIGTEDHVRAALSYFGKAANREPYTTDQVKEILGRIHSAAEKFGIEASEGGDGDGG